MSATATHTEVRDAVLWLRLQRPEALNAINADMAREIDAALDRASKPDVRVLVITGAGRAFSAGADLQELPGDQLDVEALEAAVQRIDAVIGRLASFPRPVVAGVNGIAAGGGMEIVLACDLVIASTQARLGDAHVNYGLLPGGGGSYRLPRRVGASLAKRLMYTGELLPAEELVASGLVMRVVAPDDLGSTLEQVAASLARRSPRALAAMKRLVTSQRHQPEAEAAAAERAALHEHLRTADVGEGLSAFRDGRTPVFEDWSP